jgi:hypothetical protein
MGYKTPRTALDVEADKILRNGTDRKRRAERKASPTIKASAVKALIEASLAGSQDYPGASEESVRKMLTLTEQEIAMLNAITSGKPPRNAQSILAGIRLKLEYSMKKPQAEAPTEKHPVHVTVQMLGAAPVAVAPSADAETTEDTIQ